MSCAGICRVFSSFGYCCTVVRICGRRPCMDGIEGTLKTFSGTSVYDELKTILSYYTSIEHDFDDFTRAFSIHCPDVCGRCCQVFIPDVTYLEALAVAFHIVMVQGRDVSYLETWRDGHRSCPLYDEETHRCSAYAVRPIVCRVFGSAATATREGLSFGGCRLPVAPNDRIARIGHDELVSSGVKIPVMGDYGEAVDSMQRSSKRRLLDEAILDCAAKLIFMKRMVQESDDDPSSPLAS